MFDRNLYAVKGNLTAKKNGKHVKLSKTKDLQSTLKTTHVLHKAACHTQISENKIILKPFVVK